MTTNIPQGKWIIDPTHSGIEFSVKHLMVSKVRGKFETFSGEAVTNDKVEDTKFTVTIDASSINTNEENRDNHLKSEDFFDVEKFPTISFKSKEITTSNNVDYKVSGEMTIKDTTKPVTFDIEFGGIAVDPYGNTKLAGEAKAKISRGDFGLTWNTALETGGVLVGDEITITVDIQAVLEQAN